MKARWVERDGVAWERWGGDDTYHAYIKLELSAAEFHNLRMFQKKEFVAGLMKNALRETFKLIDDL